MLRALALLLGLLPLALLEGGLRAFDIGDHRDRPDPFAGFSDLQPAFSRFEPREGPSIYRARGKRAATRRFLAEKPENGFRAFVFGGSSEVGTPYGYDFGFAEFLRRQLVAALPDRTVEVVNCALPGYASRRLVYLAEEASQYQPDLFILATGHNEIVEQRLYSHLFDYPRWLFEVKRIARQLHTYVLLEDLIERVGSDADRTVIREDVLYVPVFGARLKTEGWKDVDRDREAQQFLALSMFRSNVDQIIRRAERAGARMLIYTQAKNYVDWPAFGATHDPDLAAEALARFDELMASARSHDANGRTEEAIAEVKAAIAIDPLFADAHWMSGTLYRKRGDWRAARASYERAHATTLANFGTTQSRNEILRELAGERGALFVDMDRVFTGASPNGMVGFNLFSDFLHPNLTGYQLIATTLFDILRAEGMPEAGERWQPVPALPSPEALKREHPGLHLLELKMRVVAELVSGRPDVAREALDEVARLDPDSPELPTLRAWVSGDSPLEGALPPRDAKP